MSARRRMFGAGFAAVAPMLPGIAPFGMVAGLTAAGAGLSGAQAMAMSIFIFAGASQLATLQLVVEGAIPAVILLTALTINLRFAMYSASLAPHFQHLGVRWRLPMAYLLVDQNYALTINRLHRRADAPDEHDHWFYIGAGVACWIIWQLSTALGIYMGAGIPREWSLDFAIPLVFMVLLVPTLRDAPHIVAAVVGGGIATAAADMPFNLGIVTGAFSGIVAGLIGEQWRRARRDPRAGDGS